MEIRKTENSTEAWEEYKKSRQNAKMVISLAKQKECGSDLNSEYQKIKFFEWQSRW